MVYSNKVQEFIDIANQFKKLQENSKIPNTDKGCMAVLSILYTKKEMCSCQLAKELNLSRARLSLIVKNLKSKKLILSKFHLTDKRKIIIKITDEGMRVVEEIHAKKIRSMNTLFEKLGLEKTNLLISLFNDIIKIFEEDEEGELLC